MNLFEIPAHRPFLDDLARGVLLRAGDDPDPAALARTTILLPTRRAARSLREAFLRASGRGAILLPRLRALAGLSTEDAEELSLPVLLDLPPAVEPARRMAALTEAVMRIPPKFGGPETPDKAWRLSAELARLLDEMALEGCDPSDIPDLVPAELAKHWQVTHTFLAAMVTDWEEWLARHDLMDIGPRRVAALNAQAAAWRESAPADPVIAAGIGAGGTIPAAVELLRVLAAVPNGAVVLHGAGEAVPDDLWAHLETAHSHPLHGVARLLRSLDVKPGALRPWAGPDAPGAPPAPGQAAMRDGAMAGPDAAARPGGAPPGTGTGVARDGVAVRPGTPPAGAGADAALATRAELLARALRPEPGIACWRDVEPDRWRPALTGFDLITAADEAGEATAIALLLREALETPGATAALVTPDRDLARRVQVELLRHGVFADDSAGQPLGATPAGAFLRLIARMAEERFAPVPLLACLKHPLCAGGMARGDWLRAARDLERLALRGPRPAPGIAGLRAALASARNEAARGRASGLLKRLEDALGDFATLGGTRPAADLLADHLAAAEALASDDDTPGGLRLYAGEEGEPLARHLATLEPAMRDLPPLGADAWPALFDALLEGPLAPGVRAVRGRKGASHARVQILGLLEARLQSFDRVVLGGLEESVWPLATDPGPWMSRPMRVDFGLPAPEARIGRVCSDFLLSALSAPKVTLSRAKRRAGAPTVPARWLTRVETFLGGQGLRGLPPSPATGWARLLDANDEPEPDPRPKPCPPVAARPRTISVTDVWLLQSDPYAFYARRVLGLRAMDDLDAEADAAEYGNVVHHMVAEWLRLCDGDPACAAAADHFAAAADRALDEYAPRPGLMAYWRPRLSRIADFVLESERARVGVVRRHAEIRGGMDLPCGVRLEGRADRLDLMADGTLEIVDFKTGTPPSHEEMADGRAPQLPLEAAIAASGGFHGIPAADPSALAHWRVSGGFVPGEVKPFDPKKRTLDEVVADALGSTDRLARDFLLSERPFLARPHAARAPKGTEYDHLSRYDEWGAAEDEAP